MLRFTIPLSVVLFFLLLISGSATAHFGMLIPSDNMVMQNDNRTIKLNLSFSHPFEQVGMKLSKPQRFTVRHGDVTHDLSHTLSPATIMDHPSLSCNYAIKRPGIYQFFMEPTPYWEPAEDCFIIHYTKTVVAAFGDDEGWDEELGLKTEIVPLSKPFGLYQGNLFQGIVKIDGKPAAYAEVEIEYYNETGTARAPSEYMITQTIKADANGLFSYAVPKAGWWGFAALSTATTKLPHNGVDKEVELGAVIWVHFEPWQEKK
ncbi:MAG: DUF4198 domain-containing protein [Pseudomonadota bacterium]|nr:DUF4198 domain-containing protein [Pseudomonadota bacterium]